MSGASAAAVMAVLRSTSLAGVLPPPPTIAIRRYQPNLYSHVWLTQAPRAIRAAAARGAWVSQTCEYRLGW